MSGPMVAWNLNCAQRTSTCTYARGSYAYLSCHAYAMLTCAPQCLGWDEHARGDDVRACGRTALFPLGRALAICAGSGCSAAGPSNTSRSATTSRAAQCLPRLRCSAAVHAARASDRSRGTPTPARGKYSAEPGATLVSGRAMATPPAATASMLRPSDAGSANLSTEAPSAASSSVGPTSTRETGAATVTPAGTRPGHRRSIGTRRAASRRMSGSPIFSTRQSPSTTYAARVSGCTQ